MVTYNLGIPDGPNNPSNDQPKMKTNTNAIQTLISVDHVGFNTNGSPPNGVGGHHLQVSFDGKNPPLAQTDPQSVLYTNSGVASSVADMFYRNANRIFQVLPIKAWGYASGTVASPANSIISNESFNVDTVIRSSTGIYIVNLTVGALTGTNFGVLITSTVSTPNNNLLFNAYDITGGNTIVIKFATTITATPADPISFSFIVIQI